MSGAGETPAPDPRGDPVEAEEIENEARGRKGGSLEGGKKPEIEIEREAAGVEESDAAAPAPPETLLPPD